ncbi:MAG: gliding motility-associated C-terminal domain-containing protein [Flavobacteriales bacterium]|nr:gliding motility-associated C-terminal domain-containing protein [Flavobacteriales bacterium]
MKKSMKIFSSLLLALAGSFVSYGQGPNCASMEPICTDEGASFTAGVGTVAEPGNDYGCLSTTPNPSWYYFEIATDGDIDMSLTAPSDIDFIIWGPFADLATAISYCGSLGTVPEAPEVDCSYSPTADETPSIPGCVTGEVYIMLITNYAAVVQPVSLTQTGGTGSTDCDIVVPDPCTSQPGTFTLTKNGAPTSSPIYLCDDDYFNITSNDDYILPNDTIPEAFGGDGVYTAQLMWLVYTTPPISPTTDPETDPGYTGLILPTEDLFDTHDDESAVTDALGCGTYYLVPVAGDDGIGENGNVVGPNDNGIVHWDTNGNDCWLLGEPIEVTYSCPIIATPTVNCDPPTVTNGMDIELTGGQGDYVITNLGDGILSSSLVSNPGTALVTDMENGDNWEIEVEDGEGCTFTFNGIFSAPVLDPVSITPAPSCPGSGTGSVDATIVSGSGNGGPYTVIMNGTPTPGTSANIDGTVGTSVVIVAVDGEGCISDSTVTIDAVGHFIVVEVVETTGISCEGLEDGTATISAVPTPSGSVTDIVWTSPSLTTYPGDETNTTLTGMEPGMWEVCVTDDIGCQVCIFLEIASIPALDVFMVTSNEPSCFGFTDGSITVASDGGTPTYTYTWSPENPVSGNTFNNLGAGTYWAYVEDEKGCTDSIEIILGEPEQLEVELNIQDVACHGDSSGYAVVTAVNNAQGDPLNISYFWAPPNPCGQGIKADSACTLPAGDYTLTVNDDNGCSVVVDFEVEQPPALEFVELGYEPALCRLYSYQSGSGKVFAAAGGGVPDYTYEWENLETGATTDATTWGGLNPGNYQITVTDNNECVLTQIIVLDSLNPAPSFTMTSPQMETATPFAGTAPMTVYFTNTSTDFSLLEDPFSDTSGWWNFTAPDGNEVYYEGTEGYNTVFDWTYSEQGTYLACLKIQNKNGCIDSTCQEILVYEPIAFVPVNVFTPDGDGVNDVFTFANFAKSVVEFNCVIIDRWGVTKHEMNSIDDEWDGTDKSGSKCRDGVYFYHYTITTQNGTKMAGQGNVQILNAQ